MSAYQTEEEQIESLKRFWNRYGTPLLISVMIVVFGLFGYRAWENQQRHYAEQASALYQSLLAKANSKEMDQEVLSLTKTLRDEYPKSPYASLATLLAAKYHVDHQALNDAREALNWAAEHTKDPELRVIASLRLARVMAAQQQPKEALQVVEKLDEPAFAARISEVRGDILAQLGKIKEAEAAYVDALSHYPYPEAKNFVEMKLQGLATEAGTSS